MNARMQILVEMIVFNKSKKCYCKILNPLTPPGYRPEKTRVTEKGKPENMLPLTERHTVEPQLSEPLGTRGGP